MCCLLPCSCCPLRITLLVAGAYSMFQAISGISIASAAIALYNCDYFPDDNNFWFGFAYTYFFGKSTKTECIKNGEIWAAIFPPSTGYGNAATLPEKTNEYFIGYLVLHLVWAIASGIFLIAILCRQKRLYAIWVIVTLAVCIYDISIAGIFIADVGLVPKGKDIGTALVLPGFFSRCVIGWVINVIFLMYGFCAAKFCCSCGRTSNKFDDENAKVEIQACVGIVVGSLAICLYFCEPLMPTFSSGVFNELETNVWLKFIYVYFYDTKTMDQCYAKRNRTGLKPGGLTAPNYYVISKNPVTSPESTDKYFMGYIAANAIWLLASILHMSGTSKKKPNCYIPWIIVTIGMCLFDVALFGIYCVDLSVTVNNLVKDKAQDWSLFTVSVLLPLYFSRGGFIGWTINLISTFQSMTEVGCCGGTKQQQQQNNSIKRQDQPKRPDLIPPDEGRRQRDQHLQSSPAGHSVLYRQSNAGMPQQYHQQPQQRSSSITSSAHSLSPPSYDISKNSTGLPIVHLSSSPRPARSEPPTEERRYLPRASFDHPNKISTDGMVKITSSDTSTKELQTVEKEDTGFRYQRPWSYLRPNQPLNRPFSSTQRIEEEKPVSPYGKIYLTGHSMDLLQGHRFEYIRQSTVENHYDRPISLRSDTMTMYENSETYDSVPLLDRKSCALYASCPVIIDDYAQPRKKISQSEAILNEPKLEKKKVTFSNYFISHNSGKSHEYSQVPGHSTENLYEAVNHAAKSRGNSELCVDEFVVKNWSFGSPQKKQLSVTDLDQPSPEKFLPVKDQNMSHRAMGRSVNF